MAKKKVEDVFPVKVTEDVFAEENPVLAEALREVTGQSRPKVALIADMNVVQRTENLGLKIGRYFQVHGITLAASPVVITAGERIKIDNFQSAAMVGSALIDARVGFNDAVIALGGGTLLDVAGYAAAQARGFLTVGDEPLKLTLDATPLGYTGGALADYLRSEKIECEYADDRYLVLMASADNREEDFARLARALADLPARTPLTLPPPPARGKREGVLSIRDAMLARAERVSVRDALGRIAAIPTVSCPPAVPILVSGERIDASAIDLLAYYGIEEIDVVCE
jgi:hypothetical protein